MLCRLLLSFIFFCASASAYIPTSECDLLGTDFDECYKAFLSDTLLKQLYEDGIPELNIDPLDNIHFPETKLTANSSFANGYVNIDGNVGGLKKFEVVSFNTTSSHFPFFKFKLVLKHPELVLYGSYGTEMQINEYEVLGSGNYSIQLNDVTNIIEGNGKLSRGPEDIYHYDHLAIHRVTISSDVASASNVEVTGLLPNDPELADKVSEILNEYPLDFFKEIYPLFKPTITEVIQKVVKTYFDNVAISKKLYHKEEEQLLPLD